MAEFFFLLASCLHCWRSQRIFFPTANRCLFPHDAYNVSFFLLSLWQTGSLFIKSVFLCWQFSDSNTKNNNKKVCVCVCISVHINIRIAGLFLVLIRFEQNAFLYIIQPSETNINCTLDIRIDDEKKTPLTGKKRWSFWYWTHVSKTIWDNKMKHCCRLRPVLFILPHFGLLFFFSHGHLAPRSTWFFVLGIFFF